VSVFAFYPCIVTVAAQDANNSRTAVPAPVSVADLFNKIESLEYQATLAVEAHVESGEFVAPSMTPEKEISLYYCAAGQNYYYKIKTQWWRAKPAVEHEVAFNGELYQWLREGGVQLAIGHQKHGLDFEFADHNPLFFPFRFLAINSDGLVDAFHFQDAKNNKLVANAYQALQNGDQTSVEKRGSFSIKEFPGGGYPDLHHNLKYRVYFDSTQADYPIRWQLLTENRHVLREYIVDELADAEGFLYPRKARMLDYGFNRTTPDVKPRGTLHLSIDSIDINRLRSDDTIFTIDPARVSWIWDRDNKVGIRVPR
jgi:hypothetical protein